MHNCKESLTVDIAILAQELIHEKIERIIDLQKAMIMENKNNSDNTPPTYSECADAIQEFLLANITLGEDPVRQAIEYVMDTVDYGVIYVETFGL